MEKPFPGRYPRAPTGDHVTAGRQQRTLTMNILKLALLGSLRIAFFSILKVALCAYTLFLSDTAFAGTAREGNGQASDTVSYGHPKVTATPIWLGGTQCFRRP